MSLPTVRANVAAPAALAELKAAPAAVFFDKGTWAHRGRVQACVIQAALERGVSAGAEWTVLVIIMRKVLGLSLEPVGTLTAQSLAVAAKLTDRAVRAILVTLAGRQLIELVRDGKEVTRCWIHPALFDAARDGQFAGGRVKLSAAPPPC